MSFEFAVGKAFAGTLIVMLGLFCLLLWLAARALKQAEKTQEPHPDPVYREVLRKHRFDVWVANRPLIAAHIQAISSYATIAINAVILANSAAAGAVLTLLGALWSNPDRPLVMPEAVDALKIFATGIALGVLAAAVAYFCQLAYSTADTVDQDDHAEIRKYYVLGYVLRTAGMFLAIGGIVGFAFGVAQSLDALDAIKHVTPTASS